jgi:Zn-dependent protease with chaperone function
MRRRHFSCLALGAALCGCQGGAVTPVPPLAAGEAARASAEIDAAPPATRQMLDRGEWLRTLDRVARRIDPPARELCRELGTPRCDWYVEGDRSHELNASAAASGRVAINRGIVEYARNDEEVAFVIGHELAHQAARHAQGSAENARAGQALGALLGAGLAAMTAAGGGRVSAGASRRSVENGAGLGGRIGVLAYSKEQEREADRLALLLLWRAGYRPEAARGFLVTMARASARRETSLFDSHPAGPERLAAFDATLAELRARNGTLPLRAG